MRLESDAFADAEQALTVGAAGAQQLVFPTEPGLIVQGHLKDAEDDGIGGVVVHLFDFVQGRWRHREANTIATDGDGAFPLRGLRRGRYRIGFAADGSGPVAEFTLTAEPDLEVRLDAAGRLTARALRR